MLGWDLSRVAGWQAASETKIYACEEQGMPKMKKGRNCERCDDREQKWTMVRGAMAAGNVE